MAVLFEDTLQKEGQHVLKNEYFKRNGIQVARLRLYVGDYKWSNGLASVDTKADIEEIAANHFGDHDRWRREMVKAMNCEIPFSFLIENRDGVACLRDLAEWEEPLKHFHQRKSKNGNARRFSGAVLSKVFATCWNKYNAHFYFCTPEEAGEKLIRLLEALDRGEA